MTLIVNEIYGRNKKPKKEPKKSQKKSQKIGFNTKIR